jgi:hypothetical protein
MSETLEKILADLPTAEPTRLMPQSENTAIDAERAARLLSEMDPADQRICILTYGLGVSLGCVASALRLDPAVVAWRLGIMVKQSGNPRENASLEASLISLLQGAHPEVTTGLGSGEPGWNARDLVSRFPEETKQRLLARLVHQEEDISLKRARSGIGVGALLMVGAVVLFFIGYGFVLDRNPMWRGQERMGAGRYDQARQAFGLLGNLPQARCQTAIAWLAEGEYEKALEILEDPDVMSWLVDCRPVALPLARVDADPQSGALLPRGLVVGRRPTFIYRPGVPGDLTVEIVASERRETLPLPPADSQAEFAELAYPDDWHPLPQGVILWSIPGGEGAPPQTTGLEVITSDQRRQMNRDLIDWLSGVPPAARLFLRGHYFLRQGLYIRGADQFAALARQFPTRPYPRMMLAEIGRALGVDPALLLR